MGNFISKNVSLFLTVAALAYAYKYIDNKSKAITKPMGDALAKIMMAYNGNFEIKREWSGFVLKASKLNDRHEVINMRWYEAMEKLNDNNHVLLDEIFDNYRLKPKYIPLIDGEVSPASIATINKR
ncbi:hypothetical protein [Pseudoalteromonas aurantia]|uniref:Uncharacterized protein n=1 Tax=Pseudoalteromonas aurantia 208 TaxID=1314867 RepID=A0ABR9EE09_9GAMM|nr:hypothetical protein [Pseudoalteromonas aurantia]MBE0369221.1 hypothetical protein [Pseudoalteromonas aurantia 208]